MKKAFTLVELIVVITILAILATIGFVSFSGYLAGARDTNRISQLKSMSDALALYQTKKDLPIPDDKIDIKIGTRTIGYQGYIGANVLETIEYTEKGLDPKDKSYFSYYLTKNKKYAQLLSFLEEENEDVVAWNFSKVQAVDYSGRTPKVTGKKLGILLDVDNTPIQDVSTITASGYIDIGDVGTTLYNAIIDDEETISGTGYTLLASAPDASCRRIKQIKGGSEDGFYTVDPYGDGTGYKAYCNFDFKYTTFDSFVEDGDMENPKSLNWADFEKTTIEKHSGNSSLKFVGSVGHKHSEHYTYIKPGKKYRIEGWFKSGGAADSKLLYGFWEYDKDFKLISNPSVHVVPGTETELINSVSASDTVIIMKDFGNTCTKWLSGGLFSSHATVAFDIDDSGKFNDLPNYNLSSKGFTSIVDNGTTCTLTLNDPIGKNYGAGTKIRRHGDGATVNYVATYDGVASHKMVPHTWVKYSGDVLGISQSGTSYDYFRKGTRFVRIEILPNYQQTNNEILYVDDLKLVEY